MALAHRQHFGTALRDLCRLLASGQLLAPQTTWDGGLASAPCAFVEMMGGANLGKAIVSAGSDPLNGDPAFPPTRTLAMAEALRERLPLSVRGAIAYPFVTEAAMGGALASAGL